MATSSKNTDMFKGVLSWISFMVLLCGVTMVLLLLLFIALDPTMASGLGNAVQHVAEGNEMPPWVPVALVCVILLVATALTLVIAFRKHRLGFEAALAQGLSRIWVEFKLLFIILILLFSLTVDMYTTTITYGWFTAVLAVILLYFLCLDIGRNRQFFRHNIVHSLLKTLNTYGGMTNFEQRCIRRLFSTLAVIVGVLGVSSGMFLFLLRGPDSRIRDFFLLAVVGFAAAGVIGSILWYILALKQDLRDASILMAQIAEIYGGNLNAVNHIAPNSNLYDCAMQLNMIRTGIQKAVEEGIKADRTKVELITNVSHDIKTPLTSIISYVELLKREPDLPPHVMDYIETISRKADRLNHIVQDVFEVSKATTGNISLNLEDLDIGKLLQQTFAEMDETLRNSRLTWRVDIPDTPFFGPRGWSTALPRFSKLDSQLRPIFLGRVPCLCEPVRSKWHGSGEHPEYLSQRNHHERGRFDCPVCPRRSKPQHRRKRLGIVHCQKLHGSLRRYLQRAHRRRPVYCHRSIPPDLPNASGSRFPRGLSCGPGF